MSGIQVMPRQVMADNAVTGLYQLVQLGLNLKYGAAVGPAAAHVAVCKHKVAAERDHMHVELFE